MKFYSNMFFALGLMALSATTVVAQERHVCGFNEQLEKALQDPRIRAEHERMEQQYQQSVQNGSALRTSGTVRTIPVVVHVIQTSAQELVTMDQIQSQIDVLNEDFRKMAGTPGFGNGVDVEYEFELASIDPNGCATDGVNRVIAPQWAFHDKADEASLKGLIQWPPNKYMNIWVPRTIETAGSGGGMVIGYAVFPSWITIQPQLDGIVIHSGYFGRDSDPSTIGRTATHEVGHWVGLYHTFQDACAGSSSTNCLAGGDRVCDTPQAFDQNFGCPSINSCTDTPTDLPDQIENYMDYSDGTCQNMFTAGQKTRLDQLMQNYRSNLWSASNLSATGVDGTPAPGCTPTANFAADQIVVCVNTPVNFSDLSQGSPTSWSWTFQGGTPSTSTDQNPQVVYTAPGTYNVTMSATGLGSDTEVKTAYVKVIESAQPILSEGFESLSSGVPTNWYTEDYDQVGSWTLVPTIGSQGSSKSMKVKIFGTYSTYSVDNMNLPPMDFTNVITASVSYDWCYRKKSGFTYDSLLVNVSTDCGATWINLRTRSQSTLVTVGGLQSSTEFVPTAASTWFSDTLDLSAYAGNPAVRLQFQAVGMDGQSIYLDNINLNSTLVGVKDQVWNQADFQVSPNPFRGEFSIHYNLSKAGATTFTLLDLNGRTLYTYQAGVQAAGTHHIRIAEDAIQKLAPGSYFLRAAGPNGVATRKLIKM